MTSLTAVAAVGDSLQPQQRPQLGPLLCSLISSVTIMQRATVAAMPLPYQSSSAPTQTKHADIPVCDGAVASCRFATCAGSNRYLSTSLGSVNHTSVAAVAS